MSYTRMLIIKEGKYYGKNAKQRENVKTMEKFVRSLGVKIIDKLEA